MKARFNAVLILIGALALGACNKNDLEKAPAAAVDQGACSPQFAVAYNDIVAKSKDAKAAVTERLAKFEAVFAACEKFFAAQPVVSCEGPDASESRMRKLSVFEIKPLCDEASAFILENSAPSAPTEPTEPTPPATAPSPVPSEEPAPPPSPVEPAPTPEKPEAKKFEKYDAARITLVIARLDEVKRGFGDQKLVIVGGKVDRLKKFKSDIEKGAVFCFISSADRDRWARKFSRGTAFQVAKKDEWLTQSPRALARRQLILGLEDETLGFACGKNALEPFTLNEVRGAVRGIFEIRVRGE